MLWLDTHIDTSRIHRTTSEAEPTNRGCFHIRNEKESVISDYNETMSKRTILTTIVIPALLISGLIIFLVNNRQPPAAELVLTHQQIHFGTLPEWEGPVTRSVTAQNTGKSPLHIQSVHTGCSYAEITTPEIIQPGTETTFQIRLTPELLPDAETSATATIFTDSPKTPVVHLTIVAAAKRFATLTPNVCEFGKVGPETIHQKTLKLTVNAPLNTSDIHLLPSGHEALTAEITPNLETDTALITVQLSSLKDGGAFASLLTLHFPNQRTLILPVTANVVRTDN